MVEVQTLKVGPYLEIGSITPTDPMRIVEWTKDGLTDRCCHGRAGRSVMLNKGPYLFEAIDALDQLLERMDVHQHKKTPQLRRLKSW